MQKKKKGRKKKEIKEQIRALKTVYRMHHCQHRYMIDSMERCQHEICNVIKHAYYAELLIIL